MIKFNLFDNIFTTSIIIILGLGGFGKMGFVIALPFVIAYVILRPYTLRFLPNKEKESKEPQNQKEFDDIEEFDKE